MLVLVARLAICETWATSPPPSKQGQSNHTLNVVVLYLGQQALHIPDLLLKHRFRPWQNPPHLLQVEWVDVLNSLSQAQHLVTPFSKVTLPAAANVFCALGSASCDNRMEISPGCYPKYQRPNMQFHLKCTAHDVSGFTMARNCSRRELHTLSVLQC